MRFTKNLEDLKSRIATACAAANRSETEVSILAVSKRHSVAAIQEAVAAGLHSMGENYLQEALEKISLIADPVEWHFIGKIQSNKTRAIAENFSWVHTVSTAKVARRLNEQRPAHMAPLNVCIQINTDDSDHGGVNPDSARELCALIHDLPRLQLRGLMTIPLPSDELEHQRQPFRRLRELRDELAATGTALDTLSMGMTGDMEAAILEGSTMLRIGTALFGPRTG